MPADRGLQAAWIDFALPAGGRLQLSARPGPSGSNSYDWAYIARFEID